ncbi:hypothetical protein EON64_20890, partial [archaeon]
AMVGNECASTLLYVSCMSLFAQVSDPVIGGSYMTLLNTLANLGSKWPAVLALFLLPKLTLYAQGDGQGEVALDGLTPLSFVGLLGGSLWLVMWGPSVLALQSLPVSDWHVSSPAKHS